MSEETGAGEEPKIIVDDDWKSQVEKEKEEVPDIESDHHGKFFIDYGKPISNRTHITWEFIDEVKIA